jgi:hypothetical protein
VHGHATREGDIDRAENGGNSNGVGTVDEKLAQRLACPQAKKNARASRVSSEGGLRTDQVSRQVTGAGGAQENGPTPTNQLD